MRIALLPVITLLACREPSAPDPVPTAEAAPASSQAPQLEPAQDPTPAHEPEPAIDKHRDISSLTEEERKAFLLALGEKVYLTGDGGLACVTCHQKDGRGVTGAFPPLVGQKEWMGDCKQHAGLIINGLRGEIEVDGVKYNGVMVPQGAALNDLQVAAVISYVRQSWGNDYGFCTPTEVAAAR